MASSQDAGLDSFRSKVFVVGFYNSEVQSMFGKPLILRGLSSAANSLGGSTFAGAYHTDHPWRCWLHAECRLPGWWLLPSARHLETKKSYRQGLSETERERLREKDRERERET